MLAIEPEEVRARFLADLGYVSAKVGANAAVFDDHDRVLLVHRADDRQWGLVAGWVDPNEEPGEAICRELQEEIGVTARIDRLVGVFGRSGHSGHGPHGAVSIVYLCSLDSVAFTVQPHEVLDIRWLAIEDVQDWHKDHETYARAARETWWRFRAGL